MMKLDTFEESLRIWSEAESGRPVGLAEIPGKNPNIPYAILQPINSPRGYGDNLDPESMRDYVFQVTCVGKSPRQARWMSDKMREVYIGRDADGVFIHDMTNLPDIPDDPNGPATTPPGASVVPGSRYSDAVGAIVKSGDLVYQTVDTYRLKVAP